MFILNKNLHSQFNLGIAYKQTFIFIWKILAALLYKPETDELFVLAKDTMSAVNVFSCKEGKYSKQVSKDVNQHLTAICCRRQPHLGTSCSTHIPEETAVHTGGY